MKKVYRRKDTPIVKHGAGATHLTMPAIEGIGENEEEEEEEEEEEREKEGEGGGGGAEQNIVSSCDTRFRQTTSNVPSSANPHSPPPPPPSPSPSLPVSSPTQTASRSHDDGAGIAERSFGAADDNDDVCRRRAEKEKADDGINPRDNTEDIFQSGISFSRGFRTGSVAEGEDEEEDVFGGNDGLHQNEATVVRASRSSCTSSGKAGNGIAEKTASCNSLGSSTTRLGEYTETATERLSDDIITNTRSGSESMGRPENAGTGTADGNSATVKQGRFSSQSSPSADEPPSVGPQLRTGSVGDAERSSWVRPKTGRVLHRKNTPAALPKVEKLYVTKNRLPTEDLLAEELMESGD